MPAILTDSTAEYLAAMAPPADDLVEEMEAHADRDGIPIADRAVAHLQAILARATGADRALEFGTAIGYSTLHVARTGTDVVTMEVDRERIEAAREYLRRDGVPATVTDDPRDAAGGAPGPDDGGTGEVDAATSGEPGHVTIVEAPALEVLGALEGPFDLAFLDAVKGEYEAYLERTLPLVPVGGVVLADNLLWAGHVPAADAELEDADDWRRESTGALRAFNETFVGHERLDAIVSPLGDGTGIATKLE